jgi:Lon protease-like protein
MTRTFPLFPLGIVVYPGEEIRLHIFEARYKQLIQECMNEKQSFGIVPVIDQKMSGVATEIEIRRLDRKYPGGEMDISCEGIRKWRILDFRPVASPKLYPDGDLEPIHDFPDSDPVLRNAVFLLLGRLNAILGLKLTVVADPAEVHSYRVGHHAGLQLEQEYQLLAINRETDRLEYLRTHLETIIPIVTETQRLKTRAKLNGHHKSLLPPDY